jgi:hypothetical protein
MLLLCTSYGKVAGTVMDDSLDGSITKTAYREYTLSSCL